MTSQHKKNLLLREGQIPESRKHLSTIEQLAHYGYVSNSDKSIRKTSTPLKKYKPSNIHLTNHNDFSSTWHPHNNNTKQVQEIPSLTLAIQMGIVSDKYSI